MMFYCQIVLMILAALKFFVMVYGDFNGDKGRKASGFTGFIATIIVISLHCLLLYGAGAFSEIIK